MPTDLPPPKEDKQKSTLEKTADWFGFLMLAVFLIALMARFLMWLFP